MKIADRLAGCLEKQVVMLNLARAYQRIAQGELTRQDLQCPRTERDSTILAGLARVLVDASDACFVDRERPMRRIEIRNDECNLFGRTQPMKNRNSS